MLKKLVLGALAVAVAGPLNAQDEGKTERLGAFSLRTIIDPMSDASRGILVSETEDIRMVVKCDDNGPGKLYVSFISKNYLGSLRSNNFRPIKYRVDAAAPQSIMAYYDGRTANLIDLKPGSDGGRWLNQVLGASKLTIQLSSYDSDLYTQVIDLNGFRAGMARTAAICKDANWYSLST